MKKQIRILGIDDAPFQFTDTKTNVIGVIMRGNGYLEGVIRSYVTIDGDDATRVCKEIIQRTRHRKQLKAAMIDGIALGGFNIVDIESLYKTTKLPILTITRDQPDFEKIKHALQHHFSDWEQRWSIISRGNLWTVTTQHKPIYVQAAGLTLQEAKDIISLSTIRGAIPEPVRIAHLIASGITRGESYGKA